MKVRGILCSLLSIFYFLSPSTALGNPSLTELAPTRTTNPIFLTAPQAQFLSQILRQISEANSNYTQGNFSTARQLAQAILQNIELSSYLQADAKALLRDQIQNFQTQIANQPDCRVGFSQGCQPLSNDIFLLAAMATLKGVDQSINVAGNPPPVVPLPTTPVGPNQPLPINPIGSNPGFPGGGSGGITLPVMPTPGIGVPTNPIQPGFPTFPGTFVPRYGQEPLPIMDDIMESVLKAMGVLDIDYAARNRELRKKYGFRNNDYLASKIITDHAWHAASYTTGTNAFMIIPVWGFAISVAAFPLDLFMTVQSIVEMNIQLADLYYSGLTPREIKRHAVIAFGSAFALKSLIHFQKSYMNFDKASKVGSAFIGGIGNTMNFFGAVARKVMGETVEKATIQVVAGGAANAGKKEVKEKVAVSLGTGFLKYLAQANEKVIAMVTAKGAGAMGVAVGGGAALTLGGLTLSWVKSTGEGMAFLYRNYHKRYREENTENFISLMRNQEFAMPFISLMVGAIHASTDNLSELSDNDPRIRILDNLMTNIGVGDEANQPYYQNLTQFLQTEIESDSSTLPAELKGRLKTAHIGHRLILGEAILTMMLADDQFRTDKERKYFNEVVLPDLDLNNEIYKDYYDGKDFFIVQQNLGIQEVKDPEDPSVLGFEVKLLQNPNPMNHTARRYLSRHCRSASQEERCKALRKKPQQPIGVELNIPAIELKDPLGHRNNYTTDEDIIWGA